VSVEDAIAEAVAAKVVEPLKAEVRSLRDLVDQLRRALPTPTGTIEDAARAWGLSVSSVRRGIARGDIAARRVGRRVLVDLSQRPLTADEVAAEARAARVVGA
jgi:hypothetical protein